MAGLIRIHIICSNGKRYFPVCDPAVTEVLQFKVLLSKNSKSRIPVNQQRLVYRGQVLIDDRTLESYGLQQDHTIHLEILPNTTGDGGGLVELPDTLRAGVLKMIGTLLSSSYLMNEVIGYDGQLESMFGADPQLWEMMDDPEIVRELMQRVKDAFSTASTPA